MSVHVSATGIHKSFGRTPVLKDVSFVAEPHRLTLLTGPSGSGKTTLLNVVAGLDSPDRGSVTVGGVDVTGLRAKGRVAYRAGLGLVFQRSGLLGGLTARQNVEVGHALTGRTHTPAWTRLVADRLGVTGILDQRASGLSGGQAQRVALLRALAHQPALLLADEPTAAVDTGSKHDIHNLLRWLTDEHGTTVVLVSHDAISSEYADTTVRLVDGVVEGQSQ